jgi:3-dehydroquinate synthase
MPKVQLWTGSSTQMSEVGVSLGDRSYAVVIEPGLLACAGKQLARYARRNRLAIVSDENVWAKLGPRLTESLARSGINVCTIVVPAGEQSKSWRTASELVDQLLSLGLSRSDFVVAFGGGVIGDVAGFAASILKRGCGYVQIPTTLLAQVDSSVGGKTAINTAAGKNLVGTFHQPSLVLIDPDALDTLPAREVRAGYAEIVKYALIGDADFFDWLELYGREVLDGDPAARVHAISTSVAAKAAIVAEDERETSGRRALLNLGHTFGHALEAEAGFSDKLLHGEAVAIGMALAFAFSAEQGFCSEEDAARVRAHLESACLPVTFTADPAKLVMHMLQDKKASTAGVSFIFAGGIGQAFVANDVNLKEIESFLVRRRS